MTESDLVTVHVAPSYGAAQIMCGLLKSEGLHARVAGDLLSDEFGMAQKLGANEVGVPLSEKPLADDIIAAWKESRGEAP
ncbi:MAG: hypothetical protein GY930_19045 [bacterium]|nr:hypothetical protein [bacterium]